MPPSRRRAFAASAVCAGHALVLLGLLQHRQAPSRDAAEPARLLQVRLLSAPRTPAPQAPAAPRRPSPVAAAAPQPVAAPVALPAPARSIAEPVAAPASPGGAEAAAAASSGPVSGGGGGGALSLKPSRDVLLGSMGSNEAVNDPRSNTPKPTFEERIAMALNPELCVKVERLPDGTIKRSMGKWRGVQSTAQSSGVTSGGGSGAGVAGSGGGGLTLGGGGGGGIRLCT
ncbi:hypothetical protein [Roseateles sp. BYS96W]|uniref:Uncharacterized protein n=1 Tax=Pelomonas nitida TaxID=3299027 RepID=A0ABW7G6R7_9BURK